LRHGGRLNLRHRLRVSALSHHRPPVLRSGPRRSPSAAPVLAPRRPRAAALCARPPRRADHFHACQEHQGLPGRRSDPVAHGAGDWTARAPAERIRRALKLSRHRRPMAAESLSVCFVGMANLPALAPEYAHLGIGGAELQQTLVAKALVQRGLKVSIVLGDYGQPERASWSGVTTLKAYRQDAGIPMLRFFHPRWSKVW